MKNDKDIFYNFFGDFAILIKEKLIDANKETQLATNQGERIYAGGKLMAYHDAICLLKSQAISFDLDLKKAGLLDFNPDEYLV